MAAEDIFGKSLPVVRPFFENAEGKLHVLRYPFYSPHVIGGQNTADAVPAFIESRFEIRVGFFESEGGVVALSGLFIEIVLRILPGY